MKLVIFFTLSFLLIVVTFTVQRHSPFLSLIVVTLGGFLLGKFLLDQENE